MEQLVQTYGVFAVYLGCALEGDAAAISGAVLAHLGLIDPTQTFLAIAAGGYTTDVTVYALARLFRDHPRVIRALAHPVAARLTGRLLSRPVLLAALFRFIPGARTIAPVMLATATPLRPTVYYVVTALSALAWAASMLAVGFGAGAILKRMLADMTRTELLLLIPAGILLALGIRFVWRLRKKPS